MKKIYFKDMPVLVKTYDDAVIFLKAYKHKHAKSGPIFDGDDCVGIWFE